MDVGIFKQAQQAYAQGDFDTALDGFIECARNANELSPSDLSKFYHLIGNCYIKIGDSFAAASAYSHALAGSPEKRKPSLYVNLGTALLNTEEYEKALEAFRYALDYPIYSTPYKAHSGIGAAQLKLGNMVEAGAAYREAALDSTNPDPAKALVNLGVCFMELGRAADAITSYETALEFNLLPAARAKAYANLGQAYMAEGRVIRALEAFDEATADGSYQLSPMARHDYEIALTLKDRLEARVPGVLNTGFIPSAAIMHEEDDSDEGKDEYGVKHVLTDSGHVPVYGEPGFDPFAPQTEVMEAVGDASADDGQEDCFDEGDPDESVSQDAVSDELSSGEDSAEILDEDASVSEEYQAIQTEEPEEEQAEAPEEGLVDEDEAVEAEPEQGRRVVSPDGVDEDELEATLEELGIATGSETVPFSPLDEETADDADIQADEEPAMDSEESTGEASEEDAAALLDSETDDFSSAKTALIPPVSKKAALDIPTGEVPLTVQAEDGNGNAPETQRQEDELEANDENGIEGQVFSEDVIDSGESLVDLDSTDTHMPSPENTGFFDVTENEINQGAKEERKKARRSRGTGLKVAIMLVVLAVIVLGAGIAGYALGYGYPTQETVTRDFLTAAQNGEDTTQYWASDVEQATREAQLAIVEGVTSYSVEAVQRTMSQTAVFVEGTLEGGGTIDYEIVLSRNGISWGVEYIELVFPSQQ